MKKSIESLGDLLWYLIKLPNLLYLETWIFFLLLIRRTVPKWLKEKYLSLPPDRPLRFDPPTPYRK